MKSSSPMRGGPVFLVIKSRFTIRCIKLRLLSSYLQCWKAKCVLTFNQEMAVIYMFCAYNKILSIFQRNWNNLWVFITYFISLKTPVRTSGTFLNQVGTCLGVICLDKIGLSYESVKIKWWQIPMVPICSAGPDHVG